MSKLASIFTALVRRKAAGLSSLLRFGSAPGKAGEAQRNFATLARRGVRILVVHGDHDVGREEMNLCFGAEGRFLRRLPGITLDVIDGADHSLSSPASRGAVLERLSAFSEIGGAELARQPQEIEGFDRRPDARGDRRLGSHGEFRMTSTLPIPDAARLEPDASRKEAVVCIPTFRRPEMLAATLASI